MSDHTSKVFEACGLVFTTFDEHIAVDTKLQDLGGMRRVALDPTQVAALRNFLSDWKNGHRWRHQRKDNA